MCDQKDYDFFLKSDLSDHRGNWIAICNQKVISSEKDGKTVMEESRKKCKGKPLIAKVPEKNQTLIL